MVDRPKKGRRRRPLRPLVVVVYLGLGVAGLAVASPALWRWALVLARPAVFLPRLPRLWPWLLPAAAIAVGLYHVVQATLSGGRIRIPLAILLLLGTGVCLANVRLLPRAAALPESYPAGQLRIALGQARRRLARAKATAGRYPARFPGDGIHLLGGAAPVPTGYLSHGRSRPFRVVSRTPAAGPALVARAEDGPGTVYYVATPSGDRYFLTALLMATQPVGPARFVRDRQGHALVVSPHVSTGRHP